MFGLTKKSKVAGLQKKIAVLRDARLKGDVSDDDIAKEIAVYHQLASLYESLQYNKAFPEAKLLSLECYRAAAFLEDAKARYLLGRELLERGKFWVVIKSQFQPMKAHDKYAKDAFEEAFAYLEAADEQGFFLARRLRGMALINGWGQDQHLDDGFALVISSIEQEGAFDRATQILEELGLNKPEFFSYIMSKPKSGD